MGRLPRRMFLLAVLAAYDGRAVKGFKRLGDLVLYIQRSVPNLDTFFELYKEDCIERELTEDLQILDMYRFVFIGGGDPESRIYAIESRGENAVKSEVLPVIGKELFNAISTAKRSFLGDTQPTISPGLVEPDKVAKDMGLNEFQGTIELDTWLRRCLNERLDDCVKMFANRLATTIRERCLFRECAQGIINSFIHDLRGAVREFGIPVDINEFERRLLSEPVLTNEVQRLIHTITPVGASYATESYTTKSKPSTLRRVSGAILIALSIFLIISGIAKLFTNLSTYGGVAENVLFLAGWLLGTLMLLILGIKLVKPKERSS